MAAPMLRKWLTIGIGLKRWILLLGIGITLMALGFGVALAYGETIILPQLRDIEVVLLISIGVITSAFSLFRLSNNLLAPYRRLTQGDVIDMVVDFSARHKGLRFVAIGGGTGLPTTLRGIKSFTSNITAIVTVADDGGSSGRLRRDLGVLPPGDLRNNIVALADDESLMTQLFQYRFTSGELEGHAFGNLFIAALANVVNQNKPDSNELAEALIEVERVLNIKGRVLPATLEDVHITAAMKRHGSDRIIKVIGESKIEEVGGYIDHISLEPSTAEAYAPSVEAIMNADVIIIGPGSLYTSILPNLLVTGIADALRATRGYKIYVCNVATQPVETEGYNVADHVMALEKHIGRGVFQAILANNATPTTNVGENTFYVIPNEINHEILQRYEVRYTDLTDTERPWRHDSQKLGAAIQELSRSRS